MCHSIEWWHNICHYRQWWQSGVPFYTVIKNWAIIDGSDKVLSHSIGWWHKTVAILDSDDTVLCHSTEVTQYRAILLIHPLTIGRWLIICIMWNLTYVMAARRSWKSTWKDEGKAGGVWWWRKYWQIAVTWQVLQRTDRISLNKYPLFLLLRIDFFNKIVFIRSRLET